ncbi:hypothetical protein HaLaN_30456 [Haematococcus lacustris]|uniref:Uncharacterized protein n=1 Tax=Haematococcus lacustris TaxID=44745 RepID=A0A6A0AFI8_HAELA|nr:hypothetical protein HaLaN_30456 [Haematococcus lacustris]
MAAVTQSRKAAAGCGPRWGLWPGTRFPVALLPGPLGKGVVLACQGVGTAWQLAADALTPAGPSSTRQHQACPLEVPFGGVPFGGARVSDARWRKGPSGAGEAAYQEQGVPRPGLQAAARQATQDPACCGTVVCGPPLLSCSQLALSACKTCQLYTIALWVRQ